MGFLTPFVAYSCLHKLLESLHRSLRYGFAGDSNAPLPLSVPKDLQTRSFGVVLEPRYIFGAGPLDQ